MKSNPVNFVLISHAWISYSALFAVFQSPVSSQLYANVPSPLFSYPSIHTKLLFLGHESDCYTVQTWWLSVGVWDTAWNRMMSPSVWLVDTNICWRVTFLHWILCNLQCIIGSCCHWEFPPLITSRWQSPCTAPTAGICLLLGLHR